MNKCFYVLLPVIVFVGLACIDDAAPQIEAIKGKGAGIEKQNALISQAEAAVNARNWQEAENISKQLIAMDPDRWEYQRALADAELNLAKYQEAIDIYEKAIGMARKSAGSDLKVASAKIKKAVSDMFVREGNACLKLNKNNEALAAYTKAAELSADPGTAYFNLCATQYNTGNLEGAINACDRAIQLDPTKADAYFIKGSCMFGNGKFDQLGKYVAPAGTAETLNKYLEFAPKGSHAADVKQMLNMIKTKE